jgi:hypothetical protein
MLTNAELTTISGQYGPLAHDLTLYHGTNDAKFYSKICARQNFTTKQIFMAAYAMNGFGGTAIYGPGIYLADTQLAAAGYGNLVITFHIETTTDYLDMTTPNATAVQAAVGKPRQRILMEPQVYALLKVTTHYYVLRTPFNVIPSA